MTEEERWKRIAETRAEDQEERRTYALLQAAAVIAAANLGKDYSLQLARELLDEIERED